MLINDLTNEDIKLFESFVVGYLIVTFSNSWKDYKNNTRHKRMQMSLEDIITQFKLKKKKTRIRTTLRKLKNYPQRLIW